MTSKEDKKESSDSDSEQKPPTNISSTIDDEASAEKSDDSDEQIVSEDEQEGMYCLRKFCDFVLSPPVVPETQRSSAGPCPSTSRAPDIVSNSQGPRKKKREPKDSEYPSGSDEESRRIRRMHPKNRCTPEELKRCLNSYKYSPLYRRLKKKQFATADEYFSLKLENHKGNFEVYPKEEPKEKVVVPGEMYAWVFQKPFPEFPTPKPSKKEQNEEEVIQRTRWAARLRPRRRTDDEVQTFTSEAIDHSSTLKIDISPLPKEEPTIDEKIQKIDEEKSPAICRKLFSKPPFAERKKQDEEEIIQKTRKAARSRPRRRTDNEVQPSIRKAIDRSSTLKNASSPLPKEEPTIDEKLQKKYEETSPAVRQKPFAKKDSISDVSLPERGSSSMPSCSSGSGSRSSNSQMMTRQMKNAQKKNFRGRMYYKKKHNGHKSKVDNRMRQARSSSANSSSSQGEENE